MASLSPAGGPRREEVSHGLQDPEDDRLLQETIHSCTAQITEALNAQQHLSLEERQVQIVRYEQAADEAASRVQELVQQESGEPEGGMAEILAQLCSLHQALQQDDGSQERVINLHDALADLRASMPARLAAIVGGLQEVLVSRAAADALRNIHADREAEAHRE